MIKIGIDLSIDKSIKTGKSDLFDIDCINQSIEINGTLVSLVDQFSLVDVFSQLYYKYLSYAKKTTMSDLQL